MGVRGGESRGELRGARADRGEESRGEGRRGEERRGEEGRGEERRGEEERGEEERGGEEGRGEEKRREDRRGEERIEERKGEERRLEERRGEERRGEERKEGRGEERRLGTPVLCGQTFRESHVAVHLPGMRRRRVCTGKPVHHGQTVRPCPRRETSSWQMAHTSCPKFRGSHSSTSQLNLSRVCHKKTPYTP